MAKAGVDVPVMAWRLRSVSCIVWRGSGTYPPEPPIDRNPGGKPVRRKRAPSSPALLPKGAAVVHRGGRRSKTDRAPAGK
jgi:hypothetical protein